VLDQSWTTTGAGLLASVAQVGGREEQRRREAHVTDLAGEVLIEQDVGWLDVTMDDGVRPAVGLALWRNATAVTGGHLPGDADGVVPD
jgi:hypothetical protein